VGTLLDVGAEYTVTAKTIDIKSMTETLIADISKINLPIILNYITSLLWKEYILEFDSHFIDLMGYSTSFVKGLAYLLTSLDINQQQSPLYILSLFSCVATITFYLLIFEMLLSALG
jgi:hypothetical protein